MNPLEEQFSDLVAAALWEGKRPHPYSAIIRNLKLPKRVFHGYEFDILGVDLGRGILDCFEVKLAHKAKKLKQFETQLSKRVDTRVFRHVWQVHETHETSLSGIGVLRLEEDQLQIVRRPQRCILQESPDAKVLWAIIRKLAQAGGIIQVRAGQEAASPPGPNICAA